MKSGTSILSSRKRNQQRRVKNSDLKRQKEPGKSYFVANTEERRIYQEIVLERQ